MRLAGAQGVAFTPHSRCVCAAYALREPCAPMLERPPRRQRQGFYPRDEAREAAALPRQLQVQRQRRGRNLRRRHCALLG